MKDALIVSVLSLTPRKPAARTMGWIARTGASRWLTRLFVRAYGVDMDEASGSIEDYPTLESLFTRSLADGARAIDPLPGAIVSPVDGTCAFVGPTVDGGIEVAPGRTLDVSALVGEPLDGPRDVVVLYLSPRDYHRVHVPREGTAVRWRYRPGTLWPVFPAAVRRVRNLFARNERVMVHVDTAHGPLQVVLVGAFGVGRITLELCDLVTNTGAATAEAELPSGTMVQRGALLGIFHLGSTVVVVAPPERWAWQVKPGDTVRMGRSIGTAC